MKKGSQTQGKDIRLHLLSRRKNCTTPCNHKNLVQIQSNLIGFSTKKKKQNAKKQRIPLVQHNVVKIQRCWRWWTLDPPQIRCSWPIQNRKSQHELALQSPECSPTKCWLTWCHDEQTQADASHSRQTQPADKSKRSPQAPAFGCRSPSWSVIQDLAHTTLSRYSGVSRSIRGIWPRISRAKMLIKRKEQRRKRRKKKKEEETNNVWVEVQGPHNWHLLLKALLCRILGIWGKINHVLHNHRRKFILLYKTLIQQSSPWNFQQQKEFLVQLFRIKNRKKKVLLVQDTTASCWKILFNAKISVTIQQHVSWHRDLLQSVQQSEVTIGCHWALFS